MILTELYNEIEQGRQGKNQGTPYGLPKLEEYTDGITRATYSLIMSNSGAGKTKFTLYAFVYRPLMEHLNDDNFKVLYFSLEMKATIMFAQLLSIYIYETYGRVIGFKKIMSRKRNYILNDDDYKIIQECKPWLEKIMKKVEIYDKNASANSVYAILKTRLESMGTFTETDTRHIYTPNNPELIYNVIIDHVGRLRPSEGRNLKGEIDMLSSYLVTLRDKCGISPVVVQQANREQGNIERLKAGRSAFTINDKLITFLKSHLGL